MSDAISPDVDLLFKPGADVNLQLKQMGFSLGRVADLLKLYRLSTDSASDRGFLSYCLSCDNSWEDNIFTLGKDWVPSESDLKELSDLGVPKIVQDEYTATYRSRFAGRKIQTSDFGLHFRTNCLSLWMSDNRNPAAVDGSFMSSGWRPFSAIVGVLMDEGMDERWINITAAEFRVYWMGSGSKRVNWDSQFSWWARKLWAQGRDDWNVLV